MSWNDIARTDHRCEMGRYPNDITNQEWELIAPLLPPTRLGGRPHTIDLLEVMNAILYIGSSGCQWQMLQKDFRTDIHRAGL